MRSHSVIALIREPGSMQLPPELTAWSEGEWSMIVARKHRRPGLGRRAALRLAAKRQSWLELLLPCGVVIPALNRTRLAEVDLPALIAANGKRLDRQANALAGHVQYQITVRCDMEGARVAIEHPALSSATSDAVWQSRFAALTTEWLAELDGTLLIELPVSGDIVANAAILLPKSVEPDLDKTLQKLDSLWPEGLTIRQIGPSPAVSFASFGLTRIADTDLANAARLLGLAPNPSTTAIRDARQNALRRPGAKVELVRAAATLLEQAQDLPIPGAFHQVYFWSEGRAQDQKAQVA